MKQTVMVTVFLIGLVLRVSVSAGAELNWDRALAELDAPILPSEEKVETTSLDKVADSTTTSTPSPQAQVSTVAATPASPPAIQQNFNITPAVAPTTTVSESAAVASQSASGIAIIPMIGGTGYSGRWNDHISNTYSLGLALEVAMSSVVALEAEGSFGKHSISYSSLRHDFQQYGVGGNIKLYPVKSALISPYLGLGLMGIYYEDMMRYPFRYNRWVGAPQALAGVDVNVNEGLALGVRGSYLVPLLNRPATADNGIFSYPGYEEAAAIDSSFVRVMGTAKVSF